MSTFFNFMSVMAFCATALGIAFLIVLAMPQSKMRDVLKPVMLAIACVIYVLSPIDLMPAIALGPLGAVDDAAALYAGVKSLRSAIRATKSSVA